MNSGPRDDTKAKSPLVSDMKVYYNTVGSREWHGCYGAYNCKVLRNWIEPDPQYSGYFTQRNADSYVYFALAKYAEGQIGKYPSSPSPGRKKPLLELLDLRTNEPPEIANFGTESQDVDQIPGDEQDPDDTKFPGCSDKISTMNPPTMYEDQGNLNCRGIHQDGAESYFSLGGATVAIQSFCQSAISDKVILGTGGADLYEIAENDGFGHDLDISATWVQGPTYSTIDFTQDGAITTCEERLMNVIDKCKFSSLDHVH